ncbi:hypothetical protein B0T26DRAFT_873075 [Lasiosphaeria miniovina]|uniref:Methyltransferase type 11 domain-containing protein n=1 Tax=Lasiosphaeria miniovina TaxID=1954250 RepID=A0AA40ABE2_9PEZI|nr:uncharacterized protein B0T26DRAFT_873075 [Lasiosphaeria miniovina]KAK0712741.1 hypothetical protein B0T26DRAFT_873075 [Lasiosphaeria miniovina]
MAAAPNNDQVLSQASFWDERYSESDGSAPTHEWYLTFPALEAFFGAHLFGVPGLGPPDDLLILHLGSGDSTVPAELAARGYRRQLCVDFSSAVVELITRTHAATPGIEWRLMDGTLDAMIHGSLWSPLQDVRDNTAAYLREVYRVLKDSGRFLYVTCWQPRFMESLLSPEGLQWYVEPQVLSVAGSLDNYGYVIRKTPGRAARKA